MDLSTSRIDNITVVILKGRVDTFSAEALLASLMTLLAENPPFLIIDMQQVDYLSSAGMRTFLLIVRESERLHGKVVFTQFTALVQEILQLAGLEKYFQCEQSIQDALKKF